MRAIHLTSSHPTDDVRIFHKECKSLASAGIDTTLIACSDIAQDEMIDGVRVIKVAQPSKSRTRRLIKNPKKVVEVAGTIDTDLYHIHDPELLPYIPHLKKLGKKIIYDAHEDLPRQVLSKSWIPNGMCNLISRVIEPLENYYARRCDMVIAATQEIQDRFDHNGCKAIGCFNYARLEEFRHIGRRDSKNDRFCYIGIISRARGIKEVIHAAEIANMRLDLCGRFESSDLENEVRTMSGWKWVDYHGYVSRDEIQRIMADCFAGIVTFLPEPNHVNAMPNKLFEYMACGIPVIASDFPHWRSLISDRKVGICVDPRDPVAIAEKLNYLSINRDVAKVMGENGRNQIEQEFNWERQAKKLAQMYLKL